MRRGASLLFAFTLLLPVTLPAQSADSLYTTGQKAFQDRLFRIARESFTRLSREYPDDPQADDAEYLAAVCSFYLGEYARCLEPLRTYERRHPRSPYLSRIQYWRGSALARLEQYEEAVAALDRQIAEFPQETYFRLQSLLLKGGALEQLARLKEAAVVYRRLLAEPPLAQRPPQPPAAELLPQALFRLAGVELRLESYTEARGHLSRLLLEHPGDAHAAEAVFFLAECHYFLDELEEARKRYSRFLEGGPGSPYAETARYRLARIAARQGRRPEALEQLALLEKGFPEGPHCREIPAMRGELLFALKRYGEAAAAWRQALSAASPPERQGLHYNLAMACRLAGDTAGALDGYRRAQEGENATLRRESLFREGALLREAGRAVEALQALRRYTAEVGSGENHEEALRLQGDLLLQASDFSGAAEVYSRLLLAYPDSAFRREYLFRRANAWLSLQDIPRALKDFQKIVDGGADAGGGGARFLPESLYSIGYAYASGHEYARALPYFEKALDALSPTPASPASAPGGAAGSAAAADLRGRILLAQGVCYYNMERYEEALASFRRLTGGGAGGPPAAPSPAAPPSSWPGEGWFHLGRTLYRMERLEEAVDGFRRAADALAGRPEAAEAMFWQGNGLFRLGRMEQARDIFLSLARGHPKEPRVAESLYRAGLCESRLGRPAQSVALFDQALGEGGAGEPPAGSRDLEADLRTQILYEKGWSLFQLGRRREAVAAFEALRRVDPRSPLAAEAFFRLAEADFQAGNFRDALAGFVRVQKEAEAGQPAAAVTADTAANAMYWAGLCALKLDRPADALQQFWAGLKSRPGGVNREAALEKIGQILAAGGDVARRFYRQVEADSSVPSTLRNRVRLDYARALFPSRLEEAADVLAKIRATRPPEPVRGEVDLLTGRYHQLKGESARALEIYAGIAGSRKDGIGASAQLLIGQVLEEADRKEEAAAEYLKVGFLYPGFGELVAESLLRAGRVYEALGEPDKAQKLFRRLRAEHPNSPWARELPAR